MKKALSLILVCILLFTAMLPTFAQNAAPKTEPQSSGSVPMVRLLGDGQEIYDEDGNPVPSFVDVLSSALIGDATDAEKDESNTQESARNILKGFAEAIIAGKYEEYYDIL